MARVEDSLIQDEIATSLLGPTAEQQESPAEEQGEYATPGRDLLDEAIAERSADVIRYGDHTREQREERPEAERPQRQEQGQPQEREQTQEQTQQAAAEPTPEQVQAGIEQLDNAVKEYGLNEPAAARQFADEFCGAFGSDVYRSGVDVGALGGVMAKTALSALQICAATGGDMSKVGEIPLQNAQAFTHELLKGMGVDPRSMNVDASLLARTTLGGMMNFISTYYSYGGKVTDLAKLNDPQAAEFYMKNFMQALGVEGQVSREAALKFADACSRQMLRVMDRLRQVNQERTANQERQPRARSRGSRAPVGVRRSKGITQFGSNSDIFDKQTMETYYERTERL